ncbi:hypothetical protein LTR27_005888 [Elasticomyces elasticus]|nr:hypothetical protein LTR27_005888 [Elasticomyces elasticus]
MTNTHTAQADDTLSDMDGTYTPPESTTSSPIVIINSEPSASTEPQPEMHQDPKAVGEEATATTAKPVKAAPERRTQQQEDAKNKTLLCRGIIVFIFFSALMLFGLATLRQEFGDKKIRSALSVVAVLMICLWFPSKLARIYVAGEYEHGDGVPSMD